MLVPRQQYSRELKIAVMREIDSGKGIAEVARMYQLSPKRLETWKGEWRGQLYREIREAVEAGAAVNGLCRAAGVSRAGYYRFRRQPHEADMNLRNQIQRIALRWPAYGYRRVHAELLRQGWSVNHKRI